MDATKNVTELLLLLQIVIEHEIAATNPYFYSGLISIQIRDMTLFGIPNCNTVKKAQDWLEANQMDYEFHDFKKKGITPEKLQEWFDAFGWEKVINRSGLTFRKLSKEAQLQINSADAAKTYLMENNSAIRRPVLERDGKAVSIGFQEETFQRLKA